MAKVEFGERSGEYIQEIDMQELIVKCDICSRQIEITNKEIYLKAHLADNKVVGGQIIEWKDICGKCSVDLIAKLMNFKTVQEKNREDEFRV